MSIRTTILNLCTSLLLAGGSFAAESPREYWHKNVDPLLDKYCLKCHAGVHQKSGLDLRSLETALRGGDNGPALIPGKVEQSRLLQFVLPGAETHMPPDNKKQLSPQEIEILRKGILKLPPAKSPLATMDSTNQTWIANYLEDLKRAEPKLPSPAPSTEPHQAIDQLLQARWKRAGVRPTRPAGDSVWVRRVYLDLVGRIPTWEEASTFVADKNPHKKAALVDRLIASPDYGRQMRQMFDVALMGRSKNRNSSGRKDLGWYDFLERSFRNNRPWNEIVKSMIVARGTNDLDKGSAYYLYERRTSHQSMAESIAPIVFGVQIGCAQCHNHPLAWEIEQRHYWGLVAAFNRSEGVRLPGAGVVMSEAATGGFIQFANLKKQSQPAVLAFLNGKVVSENPEVEKMPDSADLYILPPPKEGDKQSKHSIPKFSRREALSEAATVDNPMLAKAFVNRMWLHLLGRGIVHPVDEMDSRHPPSHPELLDWLARDFEEHQYDIKRLVRAIVLSKAYQLESQPNGKQVPAPETFARALEKPLIGEQLLDSVLVATGNHQDYAKPDSSVYGNLQREVVKRFPDLLPPVYNPSLDQALFFTNSSMVEDLVKSRPGNTVEKLSKLPSNSERVLRAYEWVLGRAPDREELKTFLQFLDRRPAEKGIVDMVWALVSSAEFHINH